MRVPFIFVVLVATAMFLPATAQEPASREAHGIHAVPAAAGGAALQPMQAPVLGFVSSSSGAVGTARHMRGMQFGNASAEIRAILGVPGAATLSGPLALPRGIERIHLAPGGGFGLVERATTALAIVQFNGTLALPLQPVAGALAQPAIVAFSPGGASAAVLSTQESRLQILAGLPAAPRIAASMNLADLPANIRTLALADDGITLLAGASDGGVFALRSGKTAQLLHSTRDLGGIVFAPSSTSALVFDRDGGRALMIENIAASPSTRLLAEGLSGINGDALLAFDGDAVLIGVSGAKQLTRIDLVTLQTAAVNLPVALGALQQLQAAHRFLISSRSGQPAWILDTSRETAAVYFVPRQIRMGLAR